jgi:hypothetical protein
MFENFYGRGFGSILFHEAAVHLLELAFALSAIKDSLPLESCPNKAQNRKKIEPQEQEQMGIAVLHLLQKGGQLRFRGNRNFSGDFVNSLFSAFRL